MDCVVQFSAWWWLLYGIIPFFAGIGIAYILYTVWGLTKD